MEKKKLFKKSKVVFQKTKTSQKKEKPKIKSPSNSRPIPEKRSLFSFSDYLRQRRIYSLVLLTLSVCFAAAIVAGIFAVQRVEKQKQKADMIWNAKQSEIKKWEGIVQQHSDYRDGYIKLALLEMEVGNKTKAEEYYQKALKIDPNYTDKGKMEKILNE